MNRRNFLRSMMGVSAAGIVAPLLPSQVWPFRKIFLPAQSRVDFMDLRYWGKSAMLPIQDLPMPPDFFVAYIDEMMGPVADFLTGTIPTLYGPRHSALLERKLENFLGLERSCTRSF